MLFIYIYTRFFYINFELFIYIQNEGFSFDINTLSRAITLHLIINNKRDHQRCQYEFVQQHYPVLYNSLNYFILVTRIRFLYRPDLYSIFFTLFLPLPSFLSFLLSSLFLYIFTSPAGFVGSWSCYRGYIGGGVGGRGGQWRNPNGETG